MMTIFINHSERSSVSKRSQEPYRKGGDRGHEQIMNGREFRWPLSLFAITVKGRGTKRKITISGTKDGTSQRIWRVVKIKSTYHRSNGH